MSYTNRLEEAVRQAESASGIARQWANGPEYTLVPTESGPLPTLAEFMRQKGAEVVNKVLEWEHSAHVLLQDLSKGSVDSLIFPNAVDAPQALAYWEGKYYLLQADGGTNYTTTEANRIIEYNATDNGGPVSNNFFTEKLYIGHQGLCAFNDNGLKFITGLQTLAGYSGSSNSDKGYSIVNWRGAATTQADVTKYQLFGATDSTHPFRTYYGATPTITPDGKYVVIIAQSTEESVGYYLFVYERAKVEAAANSLDVMPDVFALLPPITTDRGYYSQGVATDGIYVYTYNGGVNPLTQHTVRKFDFSGRLINEIRIDSIRGYYGYDNLYDGHPTLGCPRSMEPEGLVIRDGELLLLCVDNWRNFGDIVNYDTRQFAFVGTDGLDTAPGKSANLNHWVRTERAANAGDWNETTAYTRGSATRYGCVVVSLREASGAINEYPTTSGIPVRESIAQVKCGNSAADISIPFGEAFQLVSYSENAERYKFLMQYTSDSRQLRLYDARPESDNSKYTSIYTNFDGTNERVEYRAKTGVADGAGFNLYGASDASPFAHGWLLNTKNGTSAWCVDNFGVVKPLVGGAGVTPATTRKQTGASTPHFQLIGTSVDTGYGAIVYNNTATSSGTYNFAKARGTEAAPEAIQVADRMGETWFSGWSGTRFLRGAGVLGIARGTINSTNMGGALQFRTQASGSGALSIRWEIDENGNFTPMTDNTLNIGSGALRAKEIFAGNGVINTSDARLKTPVREMTPDEIAAAKQLAKEIGFFQWLSSVEEKGESARAHCGMTVQRAIDIMESHNLDPMAYGFVCYDEWDEVHEIYDEETGEINQQYMAAGNRYSFREGQLLMFIAKGFEARLSALENN
jgi:hypothetical protein